VRVTSSNEDSRAGLELALREVEREMEQADAMLVHLQERLHHLRRASSGLRGLLGLAVEVEGRPVGAGGGARRPPASIGARRPTELARERERLSRAEQEAAKAASMERAAHMHAATASAAAARARADAAAAEAADDSDDDDDTGGDDGTSSTDRVVELLREHQPRSIPRAAVLHEFQRRNWIEPTWSKPDAAVRMAIQRAIRRGDAEVVEGGRLIYRDVSLFSAAREGA
jgi:hypothetical protein